MDFLTLECTEGVGVLTVKRPEALNALNEQVLQELWTAIAVQAPKQGVQALILTGAGDKAFIAGADIKEMRTLRPDQALKLSQFGQKVALALEKAPYLTLAAVNGYALGGGLELALACDFIYAAAGARLGLPEVSLGLIPGFGGTQRLSRAVGMRRAKEMIMTGKPITAEEAVEIGLVNKVCIKENLLKEAMETAQAVLKNGPQAVIQAKHAINQGYNIGITEAMYLERNMFGLCFANDESREGMSAFIEKRKPQFGGVVHAN